LIGGPDRGVLVGWILQFDHGKRQAVDEQDNVWSPRVLALRNGKLVDGEPVVVFRMIEIDDARLSAGDRAVLALVFDIDAVAEHSMEGAVALDERWRVGTRESAVGILDRLS